MLTFIINPTSGGGKGLLVWKKLEVYLRNNHVSYDYHITTGYGDAARFAAGLTGRQRLVIVGGDGTTNEVLSCLKDPEKITLGLIPVGSGNDGARGLKLPTNPIKALKMILSPSTISKVDIGEISCGNTKRKFLVSSGIGFDAAICHRALSSKLKDFLNKLHIGKLTYAGIALRELFLGKPTSLTVTLEDGNTKTFNNCWFMSFMNLPAEGGGFLFAPKASPKDGLLDIAIIHDLSKIKLLALLPAAFKGRHTHFKGASFLRCKSLKITASRPLPIHSDGENAGFNSFASVRISKEKIRVISA